CASCRFAPAKLASVRSALRRSALRRLAPERSAELSRALRKSEPSRLAPRRMAPLRLTALRSAPLRLAPERSARAPPSLPEKNLSCASRISLTRLPPWLMLFGFLSPINLSQYPLGLESPLYFTGRGQARELRNANSPDRNFRDRRQHRSKI